jgi:polyphenol oxidase
MTFRVHNGIRFFTFPSFDRVAVPHAIFTRQGGVSQPPYASLNFGYSVGDKQDFASENRRRAFACVGRAPESAPDIFQVHSNRVLTAFHREEKSTLPEADGWVTNSPAFTLFLRFADCVPLLLYDPAHQVIGIAHAGWKGTISQIAARAVEALSQQYGSRPADLLAGIGPSIGPDHYTVGDEVVRAARSTFGEAAEAMLLRDSNRIRFNLWAANEFTLRSAGVEQIETANICTACHTEDWFSHRAEHGQTGRFGAMIWLKE